MTQSELPVIVCAPKGAQLDEPPWQDNVLTVCNRCGIDVVHRPYAVEPSEKVCIYCFMQAIIDEELDPKQIKISEATRKEVAQLKKDGKL